MYYIDIIDQESVIQASGMVLFEDVLKAGTLVVDILPDTSIYATPMVYFAPHAWCHPNPEVLCRVQDWRNLF